jgi:hypothetical protein
MAQATLWPAALADIRALESRGAQLAALEVIAALQDNPWLGDPLRERARVGDLRGLRRVAFDEAGWAEKPRYRLVYRNEPEDGSVHVVAVIAVAAREGLAAYRAAAARLRGEARRRLLE